MRNARADLGAHVRVGPTVFLPVAVQLRGGEMRQEEASGHRHGRLLIRVPDHRPGRVPDAHEQRSVPARDRPGPHRVPAAHRPVAGAPAPRRPHIHHIQQRQVPQVRADVQPVRDPHQDRVLGRHVHILRVPVRVQGRRFHPGDRVQPAAGGRLQRGRADAHRNRWRCVRGRQDNGRRRSVPATRVSHRDTPLDTVQSHVQRHPQGRDGRRRPAVGRTSLMMGGGLSGLTG